MTDEERIRRGHEAQQLLEHPLLAEAFSGIEQALLTQLRTVPLTDKGLEREIVRTLQVLGKVRNHIEQHVVTGRLAEQTKLQSIGSRLRRVVGA